MGTGPCAAIAALVCEESGLARSLVANGPAQSSLGRRKSRMHNPWYTLLKAQVDGSDPETEIFQSLHKDLQRGNFPQITTGPQTRSQVRQEGVVHGPNRWPAFSTAVHAGNRLTCSPPSELSFSCLRC